jgi:hypothetical protein
MTRASVLNCTFNIAEEEAEKTQRYCHFFNTPIKSSWSIP